MFTSHFNGPGIAIGRVCVSVQAIATFELNDV